MTISIDFNKTLFRFRAGPQTADEHNFLLDLGWEYSKSRNDFLTTDTGIVNRVIKEREGKDKATVSAGTLDILESLRRRTQESTASIPPLNYERDHPLRPLRDGLDYLDYQKAFIYSAKARGGSLLLADPMGLGKTIQAIGVLNEDYENWNTVVIVCPASLRFNWAAELQTWLIDIADIDIHVVLKAKVLPEFKPLSKNIVIISYNMSFNGKVFHSLCDQELDYLILDESHYLKNESSARSKAILGEGGFFEKSKRALALTGTPIFNRPIDLWTICQAFAPWEFGRGLNPHGPDRKAFGRKYCSLHKRMTRDFRTGGLREYWDWSGSKNEKELGDKLRRSIMIRREKSEVLPQLPGKLYSLLRMDWSDTDMKRSNMTLSQMRKHLSSDKIEMPDGSDDLSVKTFTDFKIEDFDKLSKAKHAVGLMKVPFVAKYVKDLIFEGRLGKIVIMAYHRDVIKALKVECSAPVQGKRKGFKAVTYMGGMSDTAKDEAIKEFQEGDADIFIGQISAAGVGLTLTASSTIVFAEMDWTPALMAQAEDRVHRIGQSSSIVNIIYCVINETLEARIAELLVKKNRITRTILGDSK